MIFLLFHKCKIVHNKCLQRRTKKGMNKNKIIKTFWRLIVLFLMVKLKLDYNLNIWLFAIITTVISMLGDSIVDKLIKTE